MDLSSSFSFTTFFFPFFFSFPFLHIAQPSEILQNEILGVSSILQKIPTLFSNRADAELTAKNRKVLFC